ncbi:hypothetical protein ABIE44_001530 [Marmoricola sp. OAE513]|uniref:hypothetical protein n=1 Tax=Marmoricola sp. OAE513 TaxID=2817894 RepID=UPI001AEA4FD3
MSLHVRVSGDLVEKFESAGDERDWFDYTHAEVEGDLVVFVHVFRRVRDRHDRTHDQLLWKHHTTKVARLFPAGTWAGVTGVVPGLPATGVELVPRRVARR